MSSPSICLPPWDPASGWTRAPSRCRPPPEREDKDVNRTEKQEQVSDLRARFEGAKSCFLVDFKGLTVTQDTELRNKLRDVSVDYRVVKNRLAKLALEDTDLALLDDHFVGPTAVALTAEDPAAVAKVLVDFAKDHKALEIKAGVLEGGTTLTSEQVKALSELPSLPQLHAQLVGLLQGPARQLATVLAEPGRQLARLLDARRKSLEESV
ncbi:MAG: 50S ribosomal protein L10 [Acidobacteria bacterium]|nr:MAG: 50S ribosomal protein L10 [Acidobacteriota bacterium]